MMKPVRVGPMTDDGYCFVCGQKNPIGLKLDFDFNGKTIKTEFVSRKEHQGYLNIVHGGIIMTLLDEAMVKLAIAMDIPAVTARMDIRLRKALDVGKKITVEAEITDETRRTLDAYAKAVTADNEIIADAKGKLIKAQPG
ncbi:MAG TPA: PaaI family thioesterase [Nitrospirae bacterium]|nr:PaaI family thioesterase [Nitrospirota bacterium]HDK16439.1 PaaI family thioesterase [Nitrospirota bacterium]HDK82463.1 PaaI family thioesterase [Nitrospirota bacterium]HDO26244.1 PaaI family thioesterase [Nitrospirota bacterium]